MSQWREPAIEAALLSIFMIAAVAAAAVLEHPGSPVRHAITAPIPRRALAGLAMGVTAAAIFYSPWGRRSGAHINPAVTLTFLRLGKMAPRTAAMYAVAQFAGAAGGVLLMATLVSEVAGDPAVNYVATVPGPAGVFLALAGELAISFGMMTMVLFVSNTPRVAPYTGAIAACLIALYITIEAPLSGMSMNPARSLAPAVAAGTVGSLWLYFVAPPAGMLLAAELYARRYGLAAVRCAKMHHPAAGPCPFNCSMGQRASIPRARTGEPDARLDA